MSVFLANVTAYQCVGETIAEHIYSKNTFFKNYEYLNHYQQYSSVYLY